MSSEQNSPGDRSRGFGFVDIREAKRAAESCKSCSLWKCATQTVFGEDPVPAPLMLVGKQPGDHEDVSGRPFVGPAGKLLNTALERAGVDRASVYVTNAVKHFKWETLGKRRLHKKPSAREIEACRPGR
jgi:uracil-DNA glycosylase family protein